MFGSYLEGSYLGESGVMPQTPPPAAVLAPQPAQGLAGLGAEDELIRLPGGIILPKKTLLLVAVGVAVVLYLMYRKKKQD